jgi:GTP-binding protein YchF
MKLGIIGLPASGKTTVFEVLTGTFLEAGRRGENRLGTVRVPDERVEELSRIYKPAKTTFAQVEYFLPGRGQEKEGGKSSPLWTPVRDCDALILVVRNFGGYGLDPPNPLADCRSVDEDLILSDFLVVQKRLERLELDQKRGKKADPEELALLNTCAASLEENVPLRLKPEIAAAPALRGFALLSAKPMLILFNNADEDLEPPPAENFQASAACMVIRGKLEHELAQMDREEAEDFLREYDIGASAADRVISRSYELLGLISFFTVGDDEVKAWTVRRHTRAVDAAGVIHSDLQKGFIRSEVLSYADLMTAGSYAAARKSGTVRLEGKEYEVQDGDILHIRFNV